MLQQLHGIGNHRLGMDVVLAHQIEQQVDFIIASKLWKLRAEGVIESIGVVQSG